MMTKRDVQTLTYPDIYIPREEATTIEVSDRIFLGEVTGGLKTLGGVACLGLAAFMRKRSGPLTGALAAVGVVSIVRANNEFSNLRGLRELAREQEQWLSESSSTAFVE